MWNMLSSAAQTPSFCAASQLPIANTYLDIVWQATRYDFFKVRM